MTGPLLLIRKIRGHLGLSDFRAALLTALASEREILQGVEALGELPRNHRYIRRSLALAARQERVGRVLRKAGDLLEGEKVPVHSWVLASLEVEIALVSERLAADDLNERSDAPTRAALAQIIADLENLLGASGARIGEKRDRGPGIPDFDGRIVSDLAELHLLREAQDQVRKRTHELVGELENSGVVSDLLRARLARLCKRQAELAGLMEELVVDPGGED